MDKINYNFKNRTALITGGAQGFGFDITKRFLESGAKVIIWDIDTKMIDKAVKDLNNSNLSSFKVDVSNFIEVESDSDEGVGEGGYAKEVSDDYKQKQAELINETIKSMDIIISTALIPEKPAPILIDKEMVESMQPGSAIIDLAAVNGGNCELTKCDEIISHNDVIIDGRSYLPSTMAQDASQLYAKNLFNLFNHIYNAENPLNLEDEITNGSLILNNGEVNNEILSKFLGEEQK